VGQSDRVGFVRAHERHYAVPVLFRLSPDDGKTTVIHFAGDTMFGRRFYDINNDGIPADGLLPLEPTIDDHMRLMAPVKPLLENADFSVVNFETPISTPAFFAQNAPRPAGFHPTALRCMQAIRTAWRAQAIGGRHCGSGK
jgi:hypothetical protein